MTAGVVAQAKPSLVDQAKPSFAGEWKMMVARGQGEPGVDLIIRQDATSMTVEYVRGPAPAPAKLTYRLDGSASKQTIPARAGGAPVEHVSRAMWAGNNIVVITTTSAGEEKRTFSMEGGYLVVEISVPIPKGGAPTITKVSYQPYERGFGG
jgi:hypothetical protein